MKRKILLLAVLLAVTSVAAIAVAVKTTCGIWIYTIDEASYYASGAGDFGQSYQEYLMELNDSYCGEYIAPWISEEGDRYMGD